MKIGKLPRRRAVSELVGSIWAIAITLVAGAGVWAYVYTQAGASESAYSSSAGQTNNFLAEKFRVIAMAMTPPITSETAGLPRRAPSIKRDIHQLLQK